MKATAWILLTMTVKLMYLAIFSKGIRTLVREKLFRTCLHCDCVRLPGTPMTLLTLTTLISKVGSISFFPPELQLNKTNNTDLYRSHNFGFKIYR